VYDAGILCAQCESKFSSIDAYGISVLLSQFDDYFKPLSLANGGIAHQGDHVDTTRLLRFLITVLWRASVSSQPFYSTVNLGPLEEQALAVLTNQTVSHKFNAVLSRWDDSDDEHFPTTGMLNPHMERWGGVNAYRLYLGKVVAYVKVDGRPFGEPFASLSLQAPSPCRIINRQMSSSKDLKAMRKTAQTAERNRREFLRMQGVRRAA
jgi:hypothetical protein